MTLPAGDAPPTPPGTPLRVALGEYDTGWHDPAGSLAKAEELVRRARKAGARLVVLPEMCTTGFTMDAERWAEPFGGADAERLKSIARVNGAVTNFHIFRKLCADRFKHSVKCCTVKAFDASCL